MQTGTVKNIDQTWERLLYVREMSVLEERAEDLVSAYGLSLDAQISQQGSCLPNSDEELLGQVKAMLTDEPAEAMHCLGLDPLLVMEEALSSASGRPARPRARLRGLAKAFKVLEHAALNLYVCPWRKEYKIIKTYSSAFIHDICPVLSPPQIHSLFGLLGYRAASSHPEQLRLAPARDGQSSLDHLLRLSCAFFLARCECCLLLAALGKRGGELEWELSLVRERQRGHVLQAALDNTTKLLDVSPPPMDALDGDVDLYGDDQDSQQLMAVSDHHNPHSVAWAGPSSDAVSNGEVAASSPTGSSDRRACGESRADRTDSQNGEHCCSCLLAPQLHLQHCSDCDATHDFHCALLEVCRNDSHYVEGSEPPQSDMPSMALHAEPDSMSPIVQPISFHGCCDVKRPDPQLLCFDCRTFHLDSCRDGKLCLTAHDARVLGMCGECGQACSRAPPVICRYCGKEYCRDCWYRNPITCKCGQTFDQSTSV
ncbi:spermatogenesis associated 2-like isoform X2 [Salarias fasciatus]|uniref:spermatogenesis associated 2-like isoform X2 n=1 Tax=Salarias fasciatus TaxID=181472 RepID=UPI001176F72C|nr:spermatogenesis-associated protein 2-like protein isoform X2 [Salarias fasciatus]